MIRQGQFHPGFTAPPPVRTSLGSVNSSGTDNSVGFSCSAFSVAAGTLIVVDVTRDGTGDIDGGAAGSAITNNKGLTFIKQSTVAAFMSTPGKWYRIERWWAYTASALTGMTCTIQWNRTGTNAVYAGQMSVYGYSNIPKANGGNPFYNKGVANPVTASNTTNTASQMTATCDPSGISAAIVLSASMHRDGGTAATAGTGMTIIDTLGPNSSSGNGTFNNQEKILTSDLGTTQATAFTNNQTSWLVLDDVIDASPLPTAVILVMVGSGKFQVSENAILWTQRTPPQTFQYNAVVWSPALNLWCAVGSSSGFATSPDGVTWTNRTSPHAGPWKGVAWSPSLGLFCACSDNTTISFATSPDGITWTGRAGIANASYRGIAWDSFNGLFIAVSAGGTCKISTSPDGTNWTARTDPANLAWNCIAVNPAGLAVSLSTDLAANGAMHSSNGTSWSIHSSPLITYNAVAWSPANSSFVAVGDGFQSPANKYQANGVGNSSWTLGTLLGSGGWAGLCWSASLGLFVASSNAASNRVATSPTGATWTIQPDTRQGTWVAVAAKS
jgi:hypothetical protein